MLFRSSGRRALALATLMLTLALPVLAQQTESRVVGRVLDQSRAALPGVTVNVTSKETGALRTAVTGADGSYAITNLRPGAYVVEVELAGFQPQRREVVLGVGQIETIAVELGVAAVTEQVTVSADAPVLDLSSARIGVNVSPVEVETLPVNGRNFANLMTLATGATSDGNGGWASVRFNGKSNQQNYLNYDGVDGTYVWDASPGYLSATGSQFRLQTSMESVAEFRVNSGLAPAESGLGSGGNITVVTRSGSNSFRGSLFEYKRDDALDAASKYDDQKQKLNLDQFGGSIGGPLRANRTFFFVSAESLRQKTGLSFTEAVPSAEARRRILAGEPVGSGSGQSAERTRAVAPLLNGFPTGTVPTSNVLVDLATLNTEAEQKENTLSLRLDHRFSDSQSAYVRYLFSDGKVDTPDRTVTPRRVLARQRPQNVMGNFQSIIGPNLVNEFKIGYNAPRTSASAFGPAGYDPVGVSLSGSFTSSSIDARGTTGIARSGLLIRATSASSTTGSNFDPMSLSFANTATMTRGAHTFKGGVEYRRIESDFQFLGSTEISYNSIGDFIDNRPNTLAVTADSPVFKPQQFYFVGFLQDSWRASDRLSLELGVRYDYYSVVREAEGRARPFFVEENEFGSDPNAFYDPDYNNIAPRLSAAYQLTDKTVLRGGFGVDYGPGQFEDRIQPIENYIERRRVQASDMTNNALAYPVDPAVLRNLLSIRGYTHHYPAEYNMQYGVSLSRELPGEINVTVGYTGSQGRDMFLRGVGNVLDPVTRVRQTPSYGQIDFKTAGCVDDVALGGVYQMRGCGRASYDALQLSATRRFRSGLTGGVQYQFSRNKGTTQGSNEAATAQNTFDFETEYGTNPQDIPHTFNGSLVYLLPGQGLWTGGWRVGGIVNARSGVPLNVVISRPDNATVNGATVTNIPGGNSRGTQRPDLVPGVDPYLKDGVRWLNPAAFTTPAAGTFGNLPRNYLRGPAFAQADLMVSKDFRFGSNHGLQFRVEMFNITNTLNYEAPATTLPNGTPGTPFTDAQAGTFGYMLGPLNRTVGLGTARQTQLSLRYSF
ncbi:MAG: TonB-dependent receptor [Acidobacteria bacterium]|nr:TonB-dependent receptor [Acidobacteriota bacterium]